MKKLEVEQKVISHRLIVTGEDVLSLLKRCKEVPRMASTKFELIDPSRFDKEAGIDESALVVIEWTETANVAQVCIPNVASDTTLDNDGEEA